MKSWIVIVALSVVMALQGCGGGGGGLAGGGTTGNGSGGNGVPVGGTSPSVYAATFQVDVKSGKVSIVKNGSPSSRRPGDFIGNSTGFTSTQLSNDSLSGTGIRSLQVTLTNNTDIEIGKDGTGFTTGLNLIFSGFINTTGIVNQRPFTLVSTLSGSSSGYLDGQSGSALYKNPTGVAYGTDGAVYIADFGNNRIRKIRSGTVSTFAGTGAASEVDGGPSKASFNGPYAIAVNPVDGALIVADFNGDKIRRITSAGVAETIAGTGAAGSANGAGNVALFTNPTGVAVDHSGNIYVSESSSNRIRKIILSGGSPDLGADYTVSTFAGNGTSGHVDGPAASAEFARPIGLVCDPTGNLYAADFSNEMIRKVDLLGNVTTIAGSGVQSELDGFGNSATFNHPFGLAYANGILFVTDASGETARIVFPEQNAGLGPTSWIVESLAGTSAGDVDGGAGDAEFNSPYGICANTAETILVADFLNNSIRRIVPNSGVISTGTPGASSASDPVTLSNPTGYVDGSDFLGSAPYISYPSSLAPGASSTPMSWQFVIPSGINSFEFEVLVEAGTGQMLPLQSASGAGSPGVDVRTLAGSLTGQSGYVNGPSTMARFYSVRGVALDALGDVFVSDGGNYAIRRIDPSGSVCTIAGTGLSGNVEGAGNVAQFEGGVQIAANQNGTVLYMVDSLTNKVQRIAFGGGDPTNSANWTVSTIAGGSYGYVNGPGNTAELSSPNGIALSSSGALYVSEFEGNRVRLVQFVGGDPSQASSWLVSLVAGSTSATPGNQNGQGASATFDQPEGMCLDGAGNLYVAEEANNDIRKIDPDGNVTTYAGSGGSFYADGAAATAQIDAPWGVCADSAGYLYVTDETEHIRRVSSGQQVTTVAGTGSSGNTEGSGQFATFSFPRALAINASGTLYVGEAGTNNIRIIQAIVGSASGPRKR